MKFLYQEMVARNMQVLTVELGKLLEGSQTF